MTTQQPPTLAPPDLLGFEEQAKCPPGIFKLLPLYANIAHTMTYGETIRLTFGETNPEFTQWLQAVVMTVTDCERLGAMLLDIVKKQREHTRQQQGELSRHAH